MVPFLINVFEYLSSVAFRRPNGWNGRNDAGINCILGWFNADSPDLLAGGFCLQTVKLNKKYFGFLFKFLLDLGFEFGTLDAD